MREPTIWTFTMHSIPTKTVGMIKPTMWLKPTSSRIKTSRRMGKGAVPVATFLSPTTCHATTFTGLVMVLFFLLLLLLVYYYLTASFVRCVFAFVDFSFFMIALVGMRPRILKDFLGFFVVAFGTKELRFALRRMLEKGSNHVGCGPTVQDLFNDIASFYNGSFETLSLNRILRSDAYFAPFVL